MKFSLHTAGARVLPAIVLLSTLTACGGGGDPQSGNATVLAADVTTGTTSTTSTTSTTTSTATTTTATTTTSATSASTSTASQAVLTDVRFENTNAQVAQSNVPVTFGQVFAPGALNPADALVGRLADGSAIPLQVDVKALHADGSVRHAIISAIVPSLPAGQVAALSLVKSGTAPAAAASTVDDLLDAGFSASVHATINGVRYSAFADDLLKEGPFKTWLSGPVASEWQVSAPLTASNGATHPHLTARFAVRWYPATKKARVDVTVENDWAYEPAPQNFTYDAQVLVGAKQVYAKPAMNHLHHARWRKVFWYGGAAPEINTKLNVAYLIGTKALPNFDQKIVFPESALAAIATRWSTSGTEPMGVGMAVPYMPQTGGRNDIGLLPSWAATYLLTMDKRARDATLGTADLAGSWSSHYRDKNTDRPVSLIDYPYMTINGHTGDTLNPATRKYEAFPACATTTACATPYTHDASHQPAFAYLPYLVTGDYYYLEELQFWAMWDAFETNPGYRGNVQGLVKSEQVRGQAWSLRTLAEAAYITPDNDRLKSHFVQILNSNLDWYNATYVTDPNANQLGVIVNGYSLVYSNGTGLGPWQDDFFTSAVGHAAELGFAKAAPLLQWKAKFPASRMTGAGMCWIVGSMYEMKVRDSATSPFYTNIGQAYQASQAAAFTALPCAGPEMATALKLKVGEMTGYSTSNQGYPSNMQPALAYAADALGAAGQSAWTVFMNRSVKPDYSTAPEFAIVPR